ncbi:hypothetical protein [Enterococcus sp. AZ102]|uniref:hypothetical protein n=1 Tax=Enterococcus sp. AZ102 TaxID=2774865 RepID=UPI003F271B3E
MSLIINFLKINFLPLVAILISIISLRQSHKSTVVNLEAKYSDDIFKNYLLKEIPNNLEKITFKNEKINSSGIDDMCELLVSIRKNSIYYKYHDSDFYEDLSEKLVEIEDFLVEKGNDKFTESNFKKFSKELNERIHSFYSIIHNNHVGKKESWINTIKIIFQKNKKIIISSVLTSLVIFLIVIIILIYSGFFVINIPKH